MKIATQQIFVANASRTNFVFVKLTTDEGLSGVGEATLEWKTKTIVGALEDLERFIVGKDPFQVEHLVETMHRDSYWRTGAVFRSALGAIEAALLDIKGKALGVPVYELLGGRHRDRLKCYANHWFQGAVTHKDYATRGRAAVKMGFSALKWDPFGSVYLEMNRRERHETIARDLAEASRLREEAQRRFDEYTGRLAGLQGEIERLVREIRSEAEDDKRRILAEAEARAARLKRDAEQQIQAEMQRVKLLLERETVLQAVTVAEQLIRERAGRGEQQALADRFVKDLETRTTDRGVKS